MSFPYYHLLSLYVLIMSWNIDAQWYPWSNFSYVNRSSMCHLCMILFYVWYSFWEFLLSVLHPKNQDHTATKCCYMYNMKLIFSQYNLYNAFSFWKKYIKKIILNNKNYNFMNFTTQPIKLFPTQFPIHLTLLLIY